MVCLDRSELAPWTRRRCRSLSAWPPLHWELPALAVRDKAPNRAVPSHVLKSKGGRPVPVVVHPTLAVRGSCLIRLPKLPVAGAQKIRASGRSIGAGRACRRPSRRDRRWILAEDKGERTRRRGARPGRRSAGRLCFRWFRPNPQGECCAREDKRIAGDRSERGSESVFDERVRTTGPPTRTSTAP